MYEGNTIIKDLRVLTEQFIPRRIIHRDGQLKEIRDNLKPIIDREIPRNSFIYGPPGTGKTCMSQYVVDELKAYTPVLSAYVNCWSYPSRFKILFNILQSIGPSFIHRKGTPTDELLDTLKSKTKGKQCVITLDEADQLEDDKILYDLMGIEGVCLILISNTETIFYDADPRVRSRLQSTARIGFRAYSSFELKNILRDRVEIGLVHSAIEGTQLERIAEASGGDARKALNILRSAAEAAKNQDSPKILDSHIEKAIPKTKSLETAKAVETLNTHQKILYGIIRSAKEIPASDLHAGHSKICLEKGMEPITERTVRKYLEKLESLNLISSAGDGRWTRYKFV